jgi:hypothetical protein
VLLGLASIEPITEPIPDQIPLGKAQRIDGEAYESPALALSYSAVLDKIVERADERQTPARVGVCPPSGADPTNAR